MKKDMGTECIIVVRKIQNDLSPPVSLNNSLHNMLTYRSIYDLRLLSVLMIVSLPVTPCQTHNHDEAPSMTREEKPHRILPFFKSLKGRSTALPSRKRTIQKLLG